MTNEQKKDQITALLRERQGAVQYGRTDTVEQIDAQLKLLGHKTEKPQERATKMTKQSGTKL